MASRAVAKIGRTSAGRAGRFLILARVQVLCGTERRRSRTYPAMSYAASPVLKVCYGGAI
jgi:hypothetical protein